MQRGNNQTAMHS